MMRMNAMDILLADDSKVDVKLVRLAFKEAKIEHHLHVVENGEEALEFLQRQGRFADAPRPDLILLDINMPRMNGHEVLDAVKRDDKLKSIPVVMLTCSDDPDDINRSYNNYANSYLTKPTDFKDLVDEVAKGLNQYWFKLVKLPVP